jgi:ribonuclease-3
LTAGILELETNMRTDLAAIVANQLPATIAPENDITEQLGLNEPLARRLIGFAIEHASHLHETGAAQCVDLLRLIEYFGSAMLNLAVADRVHSSGQIATAGAASRRTDAGIAEVYSGLTKGLALAERTRLESSIRGQQGQPASTVLRQISAQFAGVFTLAVGYARLASLVAGHLPVLREVEANISSKTLLQEFVQSRGGVPVYRLISETGPDHAKVFTAEVRTGPTHWVRGSGATKKLAEQHAAEQYLVKFAPGFKKPQARQPDETRRRSPAPLSTDREGSLRILAGKLGISGDALHRLHAALTHSSIHAQNGLVMDNTLLANLGARVIDGLAIFCLLTLLLQTPEPAADASHFREAVASIVGTEGGQGQKMFDRLQLGGLLLVGPAVAASLPR